MTAAATRKIETKEPTNKNGTKEGGNWGNSSYIINLKKKKNKK